ncbi:hypothetical protein SynRS9907_01125 [Synechococcus sp. RS9907]|nr:hypothetical protein SynRS9907_01125 [Synechococcus sp. RS9907]
MKSGSAVAKSSTPHTTRASAKRGGFFLIDPEQHLSILCSANVLRL